MARVYSGWLAVAVLAGAPLAAQPVTQVATATPPVACQAGTVPALTEIKVEILDRLGSKVSQSGQTFRFRLAEPVVIDGCIAFPAGTEGMGEVVHAKKALNSGAPGEFVAAARNLIVEGRQVRLRSLQLTQTGGDRLAHTNAVMAGGAIGGLFAKADKRDPNVLVEPGTVVSAKTAEAFVIGASKPEDSNSEPQSK